ncbi:MAG: 2'-5' RNA ligase family protein [Dehalococcoidales bacterium]|nr:MAG: 2'-5' RNA ligase family protein [Dehalococcoidales bacterium]
MITEYAMNMNGWEDWQKAYRFGVILIFPPDPPAGEVNRLRKIHDPLGQYYCKAHISLTVPLPRPVDDFHFEELKLLASMFSPFTIQYGPLSNYLPAPGVVLAIEPKDILGSLVSTLESASIFENAAPRPYPFSPHLTISEFIDVERTDELMVELQGKTPKGEFLCDCVSYAVPDENFYFTERARLELAG